MWRWLLSCMCINAEDRGKHQPRRKKPNSKRWLRNKFSKKEKQVTPIRNYDQEPIPDVFDDGAIGDPYLVQLFNERMIVDQDMHRVNSTITIQNGYRLYLNMYRISTCNEHPVLNICYNISDEELRDDSVDGFARRLRKFNQVSSIDPDRLSLIVQPSTSQTTALERSEFVRIFMTGMSPAPQRTYNVPNDQIRQLPPACAPQRMPNVTAPTARPANVTVPPRAPSVNASRRNLVNAAEPRRRPVCPWPPPPIPRDAQGNIIRDENGFVPTPGLEQEGPAAPPTQVPELSDDDGDDRHEPHEDRVTPTRRRRLRHTRLKLPSPLHRIVRQVIGDRLRPINNNILPPVRFNYDLFRLITFRHSEPGERVRHFDRLGLPLNTQNLLTHSTVPYRGSVFNRFRSVFTQVRRREYTRPGPNRPRFDPFTNDTVEQRRYIEAQMAMSCYFNTSATSPNVDYS